MVMSPWDHPRGCGDKVSGSPLKRHPMGSPPRMRGQVSSKFCISRILGITPADAGTRQTLGIGVIGGEDHPRGCGDKFLSVAEKRLNLGSPPRMRGQVVVLSASDGVMRITPADAGTSK